MSGASCICEESQNPSSISILEGKHQDVNNIISLKGLETANGNHDSNIMLQNCHNIILSNLIQNFGENSGVNTFSPLTPFSTCSRRQVFDPLQNSLRSVFRLVPLLAWLCVPYLVRFAWLNEYIAILTALIPFLICFQDWVPWWGWHPAPFLWWVLLMRRLAYRTTCKVSRMN